MSVFFILLFLGGTVYTYFTWKKDDEFKMEKELEKVKDQLHSEYIRIVNEIERNRVKQISDKLSQLSRKFKQHLDSWQKNNAEQLKANFNEAKSKDKNKKQMLKSEMQRFGNLEVDLHKLIANESEIETVLHTINNKLELV